MNHAADQEEAEKDPGLAALVIMLPILILQMILARFARRLDQLKEARRKRPTPTNWRDHFGRLRQCEWHIHQILANGARQVLAFGDVDLRAIPMIVDVPGDLVWSEPQSPAALHIRMQAIARFHSDPERYILRHATRIVAREADEADKADAFILMSRAAASRRIEARQADEAEAFKTAIGLVSGHSPSFSSFIRGPPVRPQQPTADCPLPQTQRG